MNGMIGESAWVEDEALMDPVTALSGSGPAYVFLLIEALAAAGIFKMRLHTDKRRVVQSVVTAFKLDDAIARGGGTGNANGV